MDYLRVFLAKKGLFALGGLVVALQELGLVLAPKQQRTSLGLKSIAREAPFFRGIFFEIVGPTVVALERVLDLDMIAADG